jgi:Ribosomal silencing factor during starvation
VLGASMGIDGDPADPNESWLAVCCHNFIVHVQSSVTRKAINLESLWTDQEELHLVDLTDEDAVDEYVRENQVPDEYISQFVNRNAFGAEWNETLSQLEKTRWSRKTLKNTKRGK